MKVVCEHCGLPFSVSRVVPGRAVFCCSGCALAARVPVDANGHFPVNAALVSALGAGFGFFNQGLFALLAVLLAREVDGAVNAGRFAWASLLTGVVLAVALAFIQARVGARRWVDWSVLAACAALVALGLATKSPSCALAGNFGLIAWSVRGVGRKRATLSAGEK
jgi:hypothetical protein